MEENRRLAELQMLAQSQNIHGASISMHLKAKLRESGPYARYWQRHVEQLQESLHFHERLNFKCVIQMLDSRHRSLQTTVMKTYNFGSVG